MKKEEAKITIDLIEYDMLTEQKSVLLSQEYIPKKLKVINLKEPFQMDLF